MDELNLPSSFDAECSVIGGVLINNNAYYHCTDIHAEVFFDMRNKIIWSAICEMMNRNQGVDVVTVNAYLETKNQADSTGGLSYLVELHQNTQSSANIKHYIKIIKASYAERQMILASHTIHQLAVERSGRDIKERQAEAVKLITDIAENSAEIHQEMTAYDALYELIEEQEQLAKLSQNELIGLPSGLKKLDDLTRGFRRGELVIVGGRTSMGKSVLGEMIARTCAKKGLFVRTHSYEMPAREILGRSASAEKTIDYSNLRNNKLTSEERSRFNEFKEKVGYLNWVIDADGININLVCARARLQKHKKGLDILIIDHLHLVPRKGKDIINELGEITSSLKRLAIELNIVVVVLAQLNRASASGEVREPTMTDLRASGNIEQDADLIILLHRPYYYNQLGDKSLAYVKVDKNRNGATQTLTCGWEGEYQRFIDEPQDRFITRPVTPTQEETVEEQCCV